MILVIGGSGQLAVALSDVAAPFGLALQRVGRPLVDFDRPETVAAIFAATEPSLVVNAAAYTAVDAAEDDAAAAYRANRDGPAELARLCEDARIPLIHVSTDYVFDGSKRSPYAETDATAPQCVYGASKLAGEEAVTSACKRYIILRTSWVYSSVGKNFVRTMLALAQRNNVLRVVADQRGCPTSASDLAAVILDIIAGIARDGWQDRFAGIYHAAGSGETTWHGLAEAIFSLAESHGLPPPSVEPIPTDQWPTRAKRPPDSRLDCSRMQAVFGLRLPHWHDGLSRTVDAIFATR